MKSEGMVMKGRYFGQRYTARGASSDGFPRWHSVWLDDGKNYPAIRDIKESELENELSRQALDHAQESTAKTL